MRRLLPSRFRCSLCLLVPLLVFVAAYWLVRTLRPDAAHEEDSRNVFTEEEQIGQITDAFQLYAQAFDNRFPEVDHFYGDELMRAVLDKLHLPPGAGRSPRCGFGRLTVLQRDDPSFGYRGSGARLGDPHRVLAHWSARGNRMHVLLCDLSHHEVDAGNLPSLLAPWQPATNRSVVRVVSGGSGTVVSPGGLIVTADHVVPSGDSKVDVRFEDGRVLSAAVVARSKRFDVALLRIPVDAPIPFIQMARQRVAEGQPAWVAGYGGGRSDPLLREVRTVRYVLDELITSWNLVGGGDSGAPVLDADGRLIAVLLGPADPTPTTCRTISSPTLLNLFPVLAPGSVQKD
jgi:hypothetical protein